MASQELYSKLRIYDEVVGIGVCHINGIEYVVIYLGKTSDFILKKIPSIYKGYHVKTKVTGNIFLQ